MSTLPPEYLQPAEDAAVILAGLARALEDPEVSPTGHKYAAQVAEAAEAANMLTSLHRDTPADPVWASIAAEEHRNEITYHLTRQ